MQKLRSKNVIITGGTRGIGKGIALALAEQGMNIIIQYNTNKAAALATQQQLSELGVDIHLIQSDFSKGVDAVAEFYKQAQKIFNNKVDILINNAGVCQKTPIESTSERLFDLHFDINVKAVFFLCKYALADMMPNSRIINLSGTFTKIPCMADFSCYLGSKGAVEQLTKGLAVEAARKGVTINAIAPGAIETDLMWGVLEPNEADQIVSQTAMGRLGKPVDIGNFVKLLVADESYWLTGQTVYVNGGWA